MGCYNEARRRASVNLSMSHTEARSGVYLLSVVAWRDFRIISVLIAAKVFIYVNQYINFERWPHYLFVQHCMRSSLEVKGKKKPHETFSTSETQLQQSAQAQHHQAEFK